MRKNCKFIWGVRQGEGLMCPLMLILHVSILGQSFLMQKEHLFCFQNWMLCVSVNSNFLGMKIGTCNMNMETWFDWRNLVLCMNSVGGHIYNPDLQSCIQLSYSKAAFSHWMCISAFLLQTSPLLPLYASQPVCSVVSCKPVSAASECTSFSDMAVLEMYDTLSLGRWWPRQNL